MYIFTYGVRDVQHVHRPLPKCEVSMLYSPQYIEYNLVTGLVSRHPKSEWTFAVQMNNCLKFDNDDFEHNKQGAIVKNMVSNTQSCMQGQS